MSATVVYTDGSCINNDKPNASAGIGVFFADNDPRNVSGKLPGHPQTSQRAELEAIRRAVFAARDCKHNRPKKLVIKTDSECAVKCLTVNYDHWNRHGWVTMKGKPVANQDLIMDCKYNMDSCGFPVEIQHVPAHQGVYGNEQADRHANAAARRRRY